nr:restriction endonuclease subunit S [Acidobacteriota bacterium]
MKDHPLVRLKRLTGIVGGSTPPVDERFWGGPITWYTPTDVAPLHGGTLGESARTLTEAGLAACSASVVPAGSVVVTSRAPIGNLALTDRAAATNQGCKALVPFISTDPRFIAYALQASSGVLTGAGTGTTFQEISGEDLGRVSVPAPGLAAQRLIADFLDEESDRLSQLRSLARRADTVACTFRASLFDGLMVRARRVRLRHGMKSIQQGWSPECANRIAEADEWGVLKLGCVSGGEFHWREHKALPAGTPARPELEVHPGDLLMSRGNTRELVGSCAAVEETRPRLLISDLLYRLKLEETTWYPQFVELAVNAPAGRAQIEPAALGAAGSMPKITHKVIKDLRLPDVPVDEQVRIVREIREMRTGPDDMRKSIDCLSRRLAEY